MPLGIERTTANELPIAIAQQQVLWQPALLRARAPARLQCVQELPKQEGVQLSICASSADIPFFLAYCCNGVYQRCGQLQLLLLAGQTGGNVGTAGRWRRSAGSTIRPASDPAA